LLTAVTVKILKPFPSGSEYPSAIIGHDHREVGNNIPENPHIAVDNKGEYALLSLTQ
jgi:hypothetical protein